MERVVEIFQAHCKTGDGLISSAQLSMLFRKLDPSITEENVRTLMDEAGARSEDKLKFEDFLAWLCGRKDPPEIVKLEEGEEGRRTAGLARFTSLEGGPLFEALRSGSVRLARGAYFERSLASGRPLQMRQQLAEDDLWPPEEAAKMWVEYKNLFLLVVSYGWLAREHPDPEMWHLRRLARIIREWRAYLAAAAGGEVHQINVMYPLDRLRGNAPADVGVFLDFISLYQEPRTPEQQASFEMGLGEINTLYAHEFATTLGCTAVPEEEPRKYHNRGWTLFEACVTAAKPNGFMKVFDFSTAFDPQSEERTGFRFFWHHLGGRHPPQSRERFAELMEERRRAVARLPPPHNRLFTNNKDQPRLYQKYEKLWDSLQNVSSLMFAGCKWGVDEVREMLEVLPCFGHLRELNLNSNFLGDAGADVLAGGLLSGLRKLLVWNNQISEVGASRLVSAAPASLRYLNLSENPVCGDEAAVGRLRERWIGAGKELEQLRFDKLW